LSPGASGAQRILRRSRHAVCRIGGWRRHHDRRRRAPGVVRLGGGHARWRHRWGVDREQRSTRMILAFLRYSMVLMAAMVVALLPAVTGTFAQERECPVPERFSTFERALTKTAKAFA